MNYDRVAAVAAFAALSSVPGAAESKSLEPQRFGQWSLVCGSRGDIVQDDVTRSAFCSIRFEPAGEQVGWQVVLKRYDATIESWGLNKQTCRSAQIRQSESRPYSLVQPEFGPAQVHEFAQKLMRILQSHRDFFGDCYNETGRPQPYPSVLLEAGGGDFEVALQTAEARLRAHAINRKGA